jgi:hypothetical protein
MTGDRCYRTPTVSAEAFPAFRLAFWLICDAVCDFLFNDGFLDLPVDWRVRLSAALPT